MSRIETLRLVDAICDAFEADWRLGRALSLRAVLERVPPDQRSALFAEILALELALKREAGEVPEADAYRAQYPEFGEAVAAAFADLVAPEASVDDLPPFDDFDRLTWLGAGGMGVVYRARQVSLERLVAIKMLRPESAGSPLARERLVREAKGLGSLGHSRLVKVLAAGVTKGQPYLVMEYLGGGTLAERLKRHGRPAPRVAAKLTLGLAEGVAEAHRRGIVHRDLKPANVLFGAPAETPWEEAEPTAQVADFGVARWAVDVSGLTAPGEVLGTPSAMAPEQARGLLAVGPPTDVHALGVILYELLTGRPPFLGSDPQTVLEQVENRKPTPPSRLAAGVPTDLETITFRCLEKVPEYRYATADGLADDLRRFLAGEPPDRPRRRLSRRTVVGGLMALALGSVAVPTGWWLRDRWIRARRATDFRGLTTANAAWRQGYLDGCRSAVESWDADVEPRLVADLYRRRIAARRPLHARQVVANGRAHTLAYNPSGRILACSGSDAAIHLLDAETLEELEQLKGHEGDVNGIVFSADGAMLASAGDDGTARLWNVATRDCRLTIRAHAGKIYNLAFTPDGRTLVTSSPVEERNSVKLWDTSDGSLRAALPAAVVNYVEVSPDGRSLLTSGMEDRGWKGEWTHHLWDLSEPPPQEEPKPFMKGHWGGPARFSPDGLRLGAVTRSSHERDVIVDMETRQVRPLQPPRLDPSLDIAWTPDGRFVAMVSRTGLVKVCSARSGALQGMARVVDTGIPARSLRVPPRDARTLATASDDGWVRLWNFEDLLRPCVNARHVIPLDVTENRKIRMYWQLDTTRRWLGVAQADGTVRRFDLRTMSEIPAVPALRTSIWGLTPDGSLVIDENPELHYLMPLIGGDRLIAWPYRLGRCGPDGAMRWSLDTTGHRGMIFESPDHRRLVWAWSRHQHEIHDAADGRLLLTLDNPNFVAGGASCVAFSSDGRTLAQAAGPRLAIWDLQRVTSRQHVFEDGVAIASLAFLANDVLVIGDTAGGIRFFDLDRETVLLSDLSHGGSVVTMIPSPDERSLVTLAGTNDAVEVCRWSVR